MKSLSPICFSMTLIFFICCTIKANEQRPNLKSTIQGIWYYQERDSTYSEVVISNKVYWAYDDKFGVVLYNYEIVDDNTIRRYYINTNNPFMKLKVNKFTSDTIWVISESTYEFELHRLNLNLDVNKIIMEDPESIETYIKGYRKRKELWEVRN